MKSNISNNDARDKLNLHITQSSYQKKNGLVQFYKEIETQFRENYPKTLFRYRTCTENSFNALEANQLWLSAPKWFNDPYDVLMFFDLSKWKTNNTGLLGLGFSIADVSKFNIFSSRQLILLENIIRRFSAKETEALQNIFNDFILDNLSLRRITEREIASNFKESSHLRIACFSEDVRNPVMWAHYSGNGSGFAIEYETHRMRSICNRNNQVCKSFDCHEKVNKDDHRCENRSAGHLFPIIYSDSRYDFSPIALKLSLCSLILLVLVNEKSVGFKIMKTLWADIMNEDSIIYHKLSLYKSNLWNYEKEWRLISHGYGQADFRFVELLPVAIYLGSSIKDEDAKKLKKIIDRINKTAENPIKIFKMAINYRNQKNELDIES